MALLNPCIKLDYFSFRSSLPSPMRTRAALTPHTNNFAKRRSCSRFQSLTDIDRPGGGGNGNGNQGISKERKKFVTFTVDLLSEGEPLGMTLASDTSAETPGPIYISAVTPGKNSKAICISKLNQNSWRIPLPSCFW